MCILKRPGVVNNLKSFKYKLNPPTHYFRPYHERWKLFRKFEIHNQFQKLYNLQGCTQL